MAVPSTIVDLSTTAASNSPSGADAVSSSTGPDDYLRALSAIVRREQAQATATASATTVDLGAITTGNYVHITGTTTITGFGTVAAGIERTVVFDGALTLTHNATSLILPGGANITTAAGDCAVFRSEGSGNWRCIAYQRATGYPLDSLLAALAAQTTAANNVQAYSGADTPTLLSTGTASGNIPLVGTISATDTLAGLIELSTAAEAQAFSDTQRAITPSTLASSFGGSNRSLADPGYQKLPGGLIVQWGVSASFASGGSLNVTLPVAFSTTFLAGVSAPNTLAQSGAYSSSIQPNGTTGITLYQYNYASAASSVRWLAIGY